MKNVKSMNDSLDMSYRLSHLPSGDEQIMRIDQKGKQISARDAVLPICVTAGKSGETSSLRDALQERQGNICLIGESGMGKTTAIIRILERHEMERSNGNSDVVPVFVGLNDAPKDAKWYQGDNGPESYFIRRGIACRCFGVNRISGISKDYDRRMDALLRKNTETPEYLLLLDGLNEVSASEIRDKDGDSQSIRSLIIEEINYLLKECPNVRVILTSRTEEPAIGGTGHAMEKLYLTGLQEDTITNYLKLKKLASRQIKAALADECLLEPVQILRVCGLRRQIFRQMKPKPQAILCVIN